MEKLTHTIYVTVFILLVTALGIWSLGSWQAFEQPQEVSAIDGGWASQYESHYNSEFPVKNLGTSLWAAIQYLLFDEGREGVVVGGQDWLYTQEEFKAYSDFSDRVDQQLNLIASVQHYLARQGVELNLSLVPSKVRVYPEYLDGHKPFTPHETLYSEAVEGLRDRGVATSELLSEMLAAKNSDQVFLRTDTHWTPAGAAVAANKVALTLEKQLRDLPWHSKTYSTDIKPPVPHKGDLLNYIPLEPYFENLGPGEEEISPRETALAETDTEDSLLSDDLFGSSNEEVVLVGTSYSANSLWNFVGALQQQTGIDIISYAQEGKGPVIPMMEYLTSEDFRQSPPKVVIWEFPERYLPMTYELNEYALPFIRKEQAQQVSTAN
ncbi:alginate O-acetyltransferase [Hahella ganghwensis]|uniref:alginate O-acetyltransferase n=1 Tax=Hahella ganghwensis TaxID=286420 RepID=UPI0003733AFD|nr:alginate O-acetyltransferase [Hahella ganghwensis]